MMMMIMWCYTQCFTPSEASFISVPMSLHVSVCLQNVSVSVSGGVWHRHRVSAYSHLCPMCGSLTLSVGGAGEVAGNNCNGSKHPSHHSYEYQMQYSDIRWYHKSIYYIYSAWKRISRFESTRVSKFKSKTCLCLKRIFILLEIWYLYTLFATRVFVEIL